MSWNESEFGEPPGKPGYVNTSGNPFCTDQHLLPFQKTPPSTVAARGKRDTFIWSPFNKECRPQTPWRSPPGFYGDCSTLGGLQIEEHLFSRASRAEILDKNEAGTKSGTGYEASLPGASSETSSPYTPNQLSSSTAPAAPDSPDTYFTNSLSSSPTEGQGKDTVTPSSHLASQRGRLMTIEAENNVPDLRFTKSDPISAAVAATPALLASSKDQVAALQARLNQLEPAFIPRKQPRNPRGRFIASASVQKTPSRSLKTSGGRARHRTQAELLMEAAIKCGYLHIPNVSIVTGEPLIEGPVERYSCDWKSRNVKAEEDEETTWARKWCEGIQKRRVAKMQESKGKGKAVRP